MSMKSCYMSRVCLYTAELPTMGIRRVRICGRGGFARLGTTPKASQIAFMIAARSDRTLLGAPGPTTRSKKLLGAPGIATRNKDATSSSQFLSVLTFHTLFRDVASPVQKPKAYATQNVSHQTFGELQSNKRLINN